MLKYVQINQKKTSKKKKSFLESRKKPRGEMVYKCQIDQCNWTVFSPEHNYHCETSIFISGNFLFLEICLIYIKIHILALPYPLLGYFLLLKLHVVCLQTLGTAPFAFKAFCFK